MKVSIVSVLVFGAASLATPTLADDKWAVGWAGGQYPYGNGNKPGSRPIPGHGAAKSEDCATSTIPVATTTPKPATTAPPEPPVTLPAPDITSLVVPPGPPVTYPSPGTTSPVPLPAPDCNVKPGVPVPVGCPAPDCSNLKPGAEVPAYCLPTSSVAPVAETWSVVAVPSATPSKPPVIDKPTLTQNGTVHKPTTPPVLAGASSIARGLGVGMAVAVLLGFAFGL